MKKHLSLSFVSSLCAIVCYLAFALLAFARYPLPSLFFLGLSRWKMKNNRVQRLMLLLTQGFGILGARAMPSGVLHTVTALEWVTVALLLCSLGLLGIETNRLSSAKMDRSPTLAIR